MNQDLHPVESIYREHARRMMVLAATLVSPSDAEDVVASALARLIDRLEFADAIKNPASYAAQTVLNEARAFHRGAGRRRSREARYVSEEVRSQAPEFDDPQLLAALRRLPMRQRAVLALTYWADLPPRAVAGELGISEGSVRKHLARARAQLRRELS